jgi:hypothetical protein
VRLTLRRSEKFEQRMRDKGFGNLNLIAHDFFLLIGIFLSAAIAAHLELLGQHRERAKGVGLAEQDFVLIPDIAFVMDSMVLADNDPEVVSDVFHGSGASKFPRLGSKFLVHIRSFWGSVSVKKLLTEIIESTSTRNASRAEANRVTKHEFRNAQPRFFNRTNPAWTIGRTFPRHSMRH